MKKMYNVTNQKDINKINNMAQNIKKLEVGTFDVKINKNTYFVHYEKVNVNNWYVVTVAPDNTIANEINIFITISLGVCFLINIIIVGISIYIDISNQKQNRKL